MEIVELRRKSRGTIKKCFVPGCNSNEKESPTKIFVRLPTNFESRRQWAIAVGIANTKTIGSLNSSIYCCEDHFNLKEDMESWMRFKLMGGRMRMKKGVVPRYALNRKMTTRIKIEEDTDSDDSFDCTKAQQKSQKILTNNRRNSPRMRSASEKLNLASKKSCSSKQILEPRELVQVEEEVNMELEEGGEDPLNLENMSSSEIQERFIYTNHNDDSNSFQSFVEPVERNIVTVTPLTSKDISNWISEINDTTTQTKVSEQPNLSDFMIQSGPFMENDNPNEIDVSLAVEMEVNDVEVPQMASETRRIPRILKSKSRTSQVPQVSQIPQIVTIPALQVVNTTSSPPLILRTENLQKISKSVATDFEEWEQKTDVQDKGTQVEEFFTELKEQEMSVEALTNLMIVRKPYLYTGLYGNVFSGFTNMIIKRSNESCRDVLMTLMKIRLDDSFRKLEDIFGILEREAGEIFKKIVPSLANILKDFIFRSDKEATDTTLPIQFRSSYEKIHSVIDYFRIKTHIPGDWRHDNCESIKFLISSTIDGVINFVSPGYQEDEKDSTVLTDSEYLQKLQEGTTVIANRNFYGIDEMIKQKHCTFIEPDSQEQNFSGISAESLDSYREKLNLVLESLREFEYIGPKACIPGDSLGYLNQVMIIASAIINTHRRSKPGVT